MINVQELQLNSGMLSMGSLLGTSGNQALIDNINRRSGASSYFGSIADPFRTGFQHFVNEIIAPIRASQDIFTNVAATLTNVARIRPIDSLRELEQGIPAALRIPVIYHPVIRKMLEEERIDGFGIDPLTLDDKNPYEDMLKSGTYEIHSSNISNKGTFVLEFIECSGDPKVEPDELEAIRETYRFIDEFYDDDDTKHIDFTSFPDLHT